MTPLFDSLRGTPARFDALIGLGKKVAFMPARYRIREHNSIFTPQKRVLGIWWRIAQPQTTMQAANEIIRHKLKAQPPPPITRAR